VELRHSPDIRTPQCSKEFEIIILEESP